MSINTSSRCNNQHLNVPHRCLWNKNRDKLTKKHYLLIGIQNKKMYLCMVKSRYLPRLLYKNIIEYLKVNIYGLRNWKRLYRMRYMYRWVPSRRHLWRRHLFYWSRSLHRVRNLCRGMPKWGYFSSGIKTWNERKSQPGDTWKVNLKKIEQLTRVESLRGCFASQNSLLLFDVSCTRSVFWIN